ncbi:hypothetical protein [Hoeflea sp.]|uniref:hypothetical protein n=1 Tax=Hoeflea sp. TaxID=1940281 RepID=UPI003A906E50
MKLVLFLAALAASIVPANALEWRTRDNMSSFENDPNGGYLLLDHDMFEPIHCEVVKWPIDDPVGLIECSDRDNRTIQIKNRTTLIISGYEYYRFG